MSEEFQASLRRIGWYEVWAWNKSGYVLYRRAGKAPEYEGDERFTKRLYRAFIGRYSCKNISAEIPSNPSRFVVKLPNLSGDFRIAMRPNILDVFYYTGEDYREEVTYIKPLGSNVEKRFAQFLTEFEQVLEEEHLDSSKR